MKLTLMVLSFAGFVFGEGAAEQAAKAAQACKDAHVDCTVTIVKTENTSGVWIDGKPANPETVVVTVNHTEEKHVNLVPVWVGGRLIWAQQKSRWDR